MLYEEEKIGLKQGWLKSSFIALLFLSSISSYSQVNINGFCYKSVYNSNQNNCSIYTLDYNFNKLNNLMLYCPIQNGFTLQEVTDNKNLDLPIHKFFYFPISSIAPYNLKENQHIFVSRKEKLAGFVAFTKYGTLQLLNVLKFDSYPSKIITANFDMSGMKKGIVFGKAFQGLSILSVSNFILSNNEILKDHNFSDVAASDFDFDGYNDIVAFDISKKSFVFLYNNQFAEFELNRELKVDTEIQNLLVKDINKDNFKELIFSTPSGITAFLGDSVYSYSEKIHISTPEYFDKFLIKDFNRDSFDDIAALNSESGELFVKINFTKPGKWINYISDTSLVDIAVLDKDLLALRKNGAVEILSSNLIESDSVSINKFPNCYSINPANSFNSSTLMLVDTLNGKLINLSANNKTFSKYNVFPISHNFTLLLYDMPSNNSESFYLFSKHKKLIEQVIVREDSLFKRTQFYTDYPIVDLKIGTEPGVENKTISALVDSNGTLGLIIFEYKDFRYITSQFEEIASNYNSAVMLNDSSQSIVFTLKDSSKLSVIKYDRKNNISKKILSFKPSLESDLKLFNIGKSEVLVLHKTQNSDALYLLEEKGVNKVYESDKINIKTVLQNPKNSNQLFVVAFNGAVYGLEKEMMNSPLNYLETIKADTYFTTQLFGKYYLVFTSDNDNDIKLLEIK